MISKDAIADVVEQIRGTDFYRPAHEVVYDAIIDLYGRGEPADAITVADELTKRGEIQRIGGAPVPAHAHLVGPHRRERRLLRADRARAVGAPQARRGRHPHRPARLRHRRRRRRRDRQQRAGRGLRRHRAAVVRGLPDPRRHHRRRGRRDRGRRPPRRGHDRRPDGVLGPGPADQRAAPRPDDRAGRPAGHRQGARARHAAAHADGLDDDGRGPGRRPAARRRRHADAGRRRDRGPRRAADATA